MSVKVDSRRFRTWTDESDEDASVPRTIIKYGLIRTLASPYVRILLVLSLIATIGAIGTLLSFVFGGGFSTEGTGLHGEVFGASLLLALIPAVTFLLFVGAPLFSEDMRFNAPLFYYSKPVTWRDYLLGKFGVLGVVLGATVLVPVVLFLLITMVSSFFARPPTRARFYEDSGEFNARVAEWGPSQIDSFPEWLFATFTAVPALLVFLLFLVVTFCAMSTWTTRAWHAGTASVVFLGILSMVGGLIQDSSRTVVGGAFGPFGWLEATIVGPLALFFSDGQLSTYRETYYSTLPQAIVLSYLVMAGWILFFGAAIFWRTRRMEGAT